MSRYAPGSSRSSTNSSRDIVDSAQIAPSTRSYASLMTVLPRSKRNQVSSIGLHPEDTKLRRVDRCVVRDGKGEAEVRAGVGGIDHAVVPEARGRVVGRTFRLVLLQHRIGNGALFLGTELLARARELIAFDGRQNARRLLAAHHADARVRPHP